MLLLVCLRMCCAWCCKSQHMRKITGYSIVAIHLLPIHSNTCTLFGLHAAFLRLCSLCLNTQHCAPCAVIKIRWKWRGGEANNFKGGWFTSKQLGPGGHITLGGGGGQVTSWQFQVCRIPDNETTLFTCFTWWNFGGWCLIWDTSANQMRMISHGTACSEVQSKNVF